MTRRLGQSREVAQCVAPLPLASRGFAARQSGAQGTPLPPGGA